MTASYAPTYLHSRYFGDWPPYIADILLGANVSYELSVRRRSMWVPHWDRAGKKTHEMAMHVLAMEAND